MTKFKTQSDATVVLVVDEAFLASSTRLMSDLPSMLLTGGGDLSSAIDACLTRIGELLGLSRAYLMLDEKDGRFLRNTNKWADQGVELGKDSWPLHEYELDLPSLKPMLSGKAVIGSHVRDLPNDIRQALARQSANSVLLAPVRKNDVWMGLIGFDSCERERSWTDEEYKVIRLLADLVAFSLERRETSALRKKLSAIRAVLAQDAIPATESQQEEEVMGASAERPVSLRELERRIIAETLELYNGNKLRTAKHLGLTWPALDRRCKKLGIAVKRKI